MSLCRECHLVSSSVLACRPCHGLCSLYLLTIGSPGKLASLPSLQGEEGFQT